MLPSAKPVFRLVVCVGLFACATPTVETTTVDSNDMLTQHNAARAADGVGPLLWSEQLAESAQEYAVKLAASGCKLVHSNGNYGENLFWSSVPMAADRVVQAWMSEKSCYTPTACKCDACGHYTQIVWRNTNEVGCAAARCGQGQVWVCQYFPAGNVIGEAPF